MVKEDLEIRVQKTISIGEVVFYSHDLIAFYFNDDITIGVPEVKELFYATMELTGGKPELLSLIITGQRNNISTQAFSYNMFQELKIKQTTIAEAVVIKNLATRIMANFYYKATRREFPVKVFDKEDEAISWLLSLKYSKN